VHEVPVCRYILLGASTGSLFPAYLIPLGTINQFFLTNCTENSSKTDLKIHLVYRMDGGEWTPASRKHYNLFDAVSRCTTQVGDQKSKSYSWLLRLDKWTLLTMPIS